jgi:hypothetical protein
MRVSSSEDEQDEQFYKARDNMSSSSRSNADYVEIINKLNKDFSERINQIHHNTDNKDASGLDMIESKDKEELNENKKRVSLVQKGRSDSDSE